MAPASTTPEKAWSSFLILAPWLVGYRGGKGKHLCGSEVHFPGKYTSGFWSKCSSSYLKGQCHEIFRFWFFSWIRFPPAPEYSIKTVSNFFKNSRRYSRLKVCHRCQRHRWQIEKIFNHKNFNTFVWSTLGSRGNIYINFCLQVHFQVSAA